MALHRPDYVRAPKIQKPSVARVIVRAIRNGDPPGRFLKKDATTGKWFDIGDKKAAEKTSQALREKSDEEKEGKIPAGFASPTLIVPTTTTAAAAAAATKVDAALTNVSVVAAAATAATRMMASSASAVAMDHQRVAAAAAAAMATPGIKIEESASGAFAAAVSAAAVGKPTEDPTKVLVNDACSKTDLSVKNEDVEKAKKSHVEV